MLETQAHNADIHVTLGQKPWGACTFHVEKLGW